MYLRIYVGGAYDAFAHIPVPYVPTFVSTDDQFDDWYRHKFGNNIDRDKVLPVLRYLQGHLESGRLWEYLINHILKRMGFTTTTHDRNIYRDVYKPNIDTIYIIRQVYDFSLTCSNEYVAKDIYNQIWDAIQIPSKPDKPFYYLDLVTDFNGIDI